MVVDDDGEGSFKRPGAVPFNWEIRPGIPKNQNPTKPPDDDDYVPNILLQPPKKLSHLRFKQLSPSLSSSPPSSPKPRPVSPFAPPSPYVKAKPPSSSGPPPPYWRSTSARGKLDSGSALPRWRLLKSLIGMKKSKNRDVKDSTSSSESDEFCESGTTVSPSEGSSRGSGATSWSSPLSSLSSSSSLRRNESDLSSSERKAILMMARERLG